MLVLAWDIPVECLWHDLGVIGHGVATGVQSDHVGMLGGGGGFSVKNTQPSCLSPLFTCIRKALSSNNVGSGYSGCVAQCTYSLACRHRI